MGHLQGRPTLLNTSSASKTDSPSAKRPYCVPQQLVEKLQQEVEEMLRLGVIEPSNSEWRSPVVIIFKKDSSLRICIYFRKLKLSEFDAYPMPRIDDLCVNRQGRRQGTCDTIWEEERSVHKWIRWKPGLELPSTQYQKGGLVFPGVGWLVSKVCSPVSHCCSPSHSSNL